MVGGLLGVPENFSGVCEIKLIFIIMLRCCLFLYLCVNIFTNVTKAMMGKTAGVLAQINAVAPDCTNSHCILHCQTLLEEKISFSEECLWWDSRNSKIKKKLTHLYPVVNAFLIFSVMWEVCNVCLKRAGCTLKYSGCFEEKH